MSAQSPPPPPPPPPPRPPPRPPPPPTPSVPCRTSTASSRPKCSPPDLNRNHPRPVFPAGPSEDRVRKQRRESDKHELESTKAQVRKHKGASQKAEGTSQKADARVRKQKGAMSQMHRRNKPKERIRDGFSRRGPKCTATSPKSASGTASDDEVPNAPQQMPADTATRRPTHAGRLAPWPCRTSTTTIHAQCSLPDLNCSRPKCALPDLNHTITNT